MEAQRAPAPRPPADPAEVAAAHAELRRAQVLADQADAAAASHLEAERAATASRETEEAALAAAELERDAAAVAVAAAKEQEASAIAACATAAWKVGHEHQKVVAAARARGAADDARRLASDALEARRASYTNIRRRARGLEALPARAAAAVRWAACGACASGAPLDAVEPDDEFQSDECALCDKGGGRDHGLCGDCAMSYLSSAAADELGQAKAADCGGMRCCFDHCDGVVSLKGLRAFLLRRLARIGESPEMNSALDALDLLTARVERNAGEARARRGGQRVGRLRLGQAVGPHRGNGLPGHVRNKVRLYGSWGVPSGALRRGGLPGARRRRLFRLFRLFRRSRARGGRFHSAPAATAAAGGLPRRRAQLSVEPVFW